MTTYMSVDEVAFVNQPRRGMDGRLVAGMKRWIHEFAVLGIFSAI